MVNLEKDPGTLEIWIIIECHVDAQGVVNICSPVNTALAPAIKHIACSDSASVFLPAARRIMVLGRTIRAVAIVRIRVW